MRSIRKATLGVAAAGLLVATAACGSSGDPAGDDAGQAPETRAHSAVIGALQASQQKSQEATSASFETEMTMTMTVDPGMAPLVLPMSMSGSLSWDPMAMDVTMDMSGYIEAFAGMVDPEETAAAEIPEDFEFSLRYVDGVMYMGGPVFEEELDGHTWVKVDIKEMLDEAGDDAEAAALLEQFNQAEDMARSPAEQLGLLLQSPSVTWRGKEPMNGQQTDAYEGELTLDDLLAIDPASALLSDEDVQELHDDYEEMGADAIALEVWVDEQDYPVRIDMTLGMAAGSMHYSTSYSDYGTGVQVAHPDASEVIDARELRDGGAGLLGAPGLAQYGGVADGSDEAWEDEDWDDEDWDEGWDPDMANWTEEEWEEFFAELEEQD